MAHHKDRSERWRDVADHVISMQEKYDFIADGDSLRSAVNDSAEMMNIVLTESEIIEACAAVEEHNSTGVIEE